jgi:hypothetical protein
MDVRQGMRKRMRQVLRQGTEDAQCLEHWEHNGCCIQIPFEIALGTAPLVVNNLQDRALLV